MVWALLTELPVQGTTAGRCRNPKRQVHARELSGKEETSKLCLPRLPANTVEVDPQTLQPNERTLNLCIYL